MRNELIFAIIELVMYLPLVKLLNRHLRTQPNFNVFSNQELSTASSVFIGSILIITFLMNHFLVFN